MLTRELNISRILGAAGSALLLGPRGVGKTHLLRGWTEEAPDTLAIDLLDPESHLRYLRDPALLKGEIESSIRRRAGVTKQPLRVVIDEVQKVPALLDVVHLVYERDRAKVQFLLSGSSARKLKRGGANLLAGRLLGLRLFPLTFREWDGLLDRSLLLGTLPGVAVDNPDPARTLRSYVHTYLKEEVLEESLVRKVEGFSRFLEVAANYHGEILNAKEIGRAADVSTNTVLAYLQILEDTLVAFRVPGWSASVRKQLRTSPKLYLFDNGVASALRGELRLEITERTSRYGKLFEGFVMQEAYRLNEYEQLDLKLSYWRTNNGREVNLVFSRGVGPPLAAVEIKSASAPDRSDVASLLSFAEEYPNTPLFCFCRTPRAYEIDRVSVLPWKEGIERMRTL